jgi:hypothetical protein
MNTDDTDFAAKTYGPAILSQARQALARLRLLPRRRRIGSAAHEGYKSRWHLVWLDRFSLLAISSLIRVISVHQR